MMSQPYLKDEVPLSHITAHIIAAAKEVFSTLGPGFREWFYYMDQCPQCPSVFQ